MLNMLRLTLRLEIRTSEGKLSDKVRESRLKWFEYVQRTDIMLKTEQ